MILLNLKIYLFWYLNLWKCMFTCNKKIFFKYRYSYKSWRIMDESCENDIYTSRWLQDSFYNFLPKIQTHVSNHEYLPLSSYNHSLGQIPIWFALPSFPLMIRNCFSTPIVGRNADQIPTFLTLIVYSDTI